MEILKVPPYQLEAEQSLLGALLLDNSPIQDIPLSGDEFYKKSHRMIYGAIKEVHGRKEIADLLTVSNELETKKRLESVGGTSYLLKLTEWVCDGKNAPAYATIIKSKADLRRLIQAANEMTSLAYNNADPMDVIEKAKNAISRMENGRCDASDEDGCDIKSGMKQMLEIIDKRIKLQGKIPGLSTGFEKLDQITCGMFPQDVWVLAGRPGQGKTALALNITRFAAQDGVKILWFSLDMSKSGLHERLLSTETQINMAKLRSGNLREYDQGNIFNAAFKLGELPITILDKPCSEVDIARQTRKRKPGLVVIDHLTKIKPSVDYGSVNNNYGAVSKAIKNIAKEMDIPVLLLCQLNRSNDRENRPPKESDLRDSGEIEQDADTIVFIHSKDKSQPERDLIIAKQRQGELAVLKFSFQGEIQRFEPLIDWKK